MREEGRVEADLAARTERTRSDGPRPGWNEAEGQHLDCDALLHLNLTVTTGFPDLRERHRGGAPLWKPHGLQWYGWGILRCGVRASLRACLRGWRHGAACGLDGALDTFADALAGHSTGQRAVAGAVYHFSANGAFGSYLPVFPGPGTAQIAAAQRQTHGRGLLARMLDGARTRDDVRALLSVGARPRQVWQAWRWRPGPLADMLADGQLAGGQLVGGQLAGDQLAGGQLAGGRLPAGLAGLVGKIIFDVAVFDYNPGEVASAAVRLLDSPARALLVPTARQDLARWCWRVLERADLAGTMGEFLRAQNIALLRLSAKLSSELAAVLRAEPPTPP